MLRNLKRIVKKQIFLLFTLVLSLFLLFFLRENFYRTLTLELSIWFWYFLGKKAKNFTYASFLLLWFVLPFNISMQVFIGNVNPYVNGIFTNYLVPVITILDLFGIILLLSSILEKKFSFQPFSWDIGLLVIFGIFQLVLGSEIISIIGIARISLYLLCFRVAINNTNIKGDQKYLWATKGLVLIQTGIASLQFLRGSSLGITFLGESIFSAGMKGSNFIDLAGNLYMRGYGTFPHPNILAGWLLLTLVVLWKEKKGFFFLIVSSLGILLTFSRLGIFLLGMFWIFVIIDYFKEKKKFDIFSFFLILPERILNLFRGEDSAVVDRINLLVEAWEVFKNNWVLGTGYNTFVKEMGKNMPRTANGVWLNQPVHNVFLLSLCELGILGTVLIGILYWRTFFKRKIRVRNIKNVFIVICLISIGIVDHYLFSFPQGLIIGMMMLFLIY